MTILARNKLSTYSSPPLSEGSSQIGMTETKRDDPSSSYFTYPDWLLPLNAPKLVSWLKECHIQAGLQFMEPFSRHTRQAKKLVDNHDEEDLIKAVKRASQLSKHSFTFKFVEKILNENSD